MGEFRPGHADVFRQRAERLRAIARRLADQAQRLPTGREQSFLMGQAAHFETEARGFEADANMIERLWAQRDCAEGRTVFIAEAPPRDDADARAGRVRLSY